jgi:hypothetical protein
MYHIAELPGLDGATPTALNDNNDVAGYGYGATERQGIIWYGDGSTLILPPTEFSVLFEIDQAGTAVGWASPPPADGPPHALMVQNKISIDLGAYREAMCINGPAAGDPHLVCLSDGAGVIALDASTHSTAFTVTLAGHDLEPATINNNGDVAGRSFGGNDPVSFLFRNGALMNDTPANGGIVKLNNSGQGAGYTGNPSVGTPSYTPAIWDITSQTPNSIPVTPLPGLSCGSVSGINDHGVAVGYCFDPNGNGATRAFVHDAKANVTTDLNTLIYQPGWTLLEANAINNSGHIVGSGILNGAGAAFLLTPPFLKPIVRHPPKIQNVNALLWAMLFGGVASDGGGPTLVGGHIPDWVGPLGPSILLPAAQDAVIGLAVDAVARQLGDRVGGDAIRRAALEMSTRAIERLKTAERPPTRPTATPRRRDPWGRARIVRPSRLRGARP